VGFAKWKDTYTPIETNSLTLKIGAWKMKFPFWGVNLLFVSGRVPATNNHIRETKRFDESHHFQKLWRVFGGKTWGKSVKSKVR